MNRITAALTLGLLATPALKAQTVTTHTDHTSYWSGSDGRAFLIHQGPRTAEQDGGWSGDDSLRSYAIAHSGDYILFARDGVLHKLQDPKALAEVQSLRAPMAALEAKQSALAAEQKPINEQMKQLGAQMRATSSPADQSRLGQQMGDLGRQEGAIGRQQGDVGREQGKLGRAVHDKVESLIDACLQAGTCPAVS